MFKGKHLKLQFEGPIAWSDTEINFLKTFGTDVKDTTEFCELYSAQMCACALKKCFGLRFKHPFMEIPDLIQSGYFAQPYLVRCRPEHSSNIYWPGTCAKRLPSTASPMTPLNTDANTSSLSPVTPKHSPKKKKDVVADSSSNNNNCTNSSSSGSSSSSSSANGIDNSDTSSSSTSTNDDENNSNAINTNSGIYPHLPPPGVSLLVPSPPGYVSGYGSGSSGSGGSSASPMLAQPPPPPQQQQQQQQPFVAADDFRQDIELLDQQIAAEYQTLCDIAAIQPRIPSGYVSEFLAIQSEIQGLHNGFNALKTAALTSGVPLSESQRKEAQVMADRHNELTAQMEVLVTKVNSGPGGDYDVPQEELQKEGNRQLDLLNSQLTIGAESLQKMDAIRPLVTPQIQQRYDMIYRALQFAYSRYSELKNHIMTTHQILDDSQLQEAQKISEYQNSAWIDMKLLCQELHV